jgi:hypothetical protein
MRSRSVACFWLIRGNAIKHAEQVSRGPHEALAVRAELLSHRLLPVIAAICRAAGPERIDVVRRQPSRLNSAARSCA